MTEDQLNHACGVAPNDMSETPTREKLLYYLERAGWGPCNIPACNCNGWHQVRPSRDEIELGKRIVELEGALVSARDALDAIYDGGKVYGGAGESYSVLLSVKYIAKRGLHQIHQVQGSYSHLLPGLREALRLTYLAEDSDLVVGRIMKRISELEGGNVKPI